MQMLGRSHRTNQAHPPQYVLLYSDLAGEKRFISTISRRLGSLGALTKGQKNATTGTDLMDKVNLETAEGRAAAAAFYDALLRNVSVPGTQSWDDRLSREEQMKPLAAGARVKWGADLAGREEYGTLVDPIRDRSIDSSEMPMVKRDDGTRGKMIQAKLIAVGERRQTGAPLTGMQVLTDMRVLKGVPPTVPMNDRSNVTKMMNRLLALDPDVQNPTYNYFYDIFQATIEKAIEQGTLDTGVKTIPGDEFSIKGQKSIAKDPKTGAETFYYPVDARIKTHRVSAGGDDQADGRPFGR